MLVSKCCNERLRVEGGNGHGDTAYYVCTKCDLSSDPRVSFLWEPKEKETEDAFV